MLGTAINCDGMITVMAKASLVRRVINHTLNSLSEPACALTGFMVTIASEEDSLEISVCFIH